VKLFFFGEDPIFLSGAIKKFVFSIADKYFTDRYNPELRFKAKNPFNLPFVTKKKKGTIQ
jgi:hypothetical protein